MTSLLELVSIKTNKNPIMMASPISKDLDGPFLVSANKGFVWVDEKFPGNFVRAAVVGRGVLEIMQGVLENVLEKSKQLNWGSAKTFNKKGLEDSIAYLRYFGFSELDVILNDSSDFSFENKYDKVYVSWEKWVPKGSALVLPTDKSYFGTLYSFGNGNYSCCVHNPSRGICILS